MHVIEKFNTAIVYFEHMILCSKTARGKKVNNNKLMLCVIN